MKILMRLHNGALKPVDDLGFKVIGRVKQGEILRVDVVRPRNPRAHNLYWALCEMVAAGSEVYDSKDKVHVAFRVAYGWYETYLDHKGNVFWQLKSTDFDRMDADEFSAYLDNCIRLVATRMIPGLPEGTIRHELELMCGVNPDVR